MARIRTVKPEFFEDARLAADLTITERLFYIGLWCQADDEGRFLAHPRRLLGAIFPYDRGLTEDSLSDSLRTLCRTHRVVLYEVNGEPYGEIVNFLKHQRINRPTPSKIPSYNSELARLTEDSLNTHGGLTEDSLPERKGKEQGKEGEWNTHTHAREGKPTPPPPTLIPYSDIIDLYHSIVATTPGQRVTSAGPATLKQIEQRWMEDRTRQSLDWWRDYFTRASQSGFLKRINVKLPWLTEQEHMEKLCNGQYDGSITPSRNTVSSAPSQAEFERENAEFIQRYRDRQMTNPAPSTPDDDEEPPF
jgi:hypothetical protein